MTSRIPTPHPDAPVDDDWRTISEELLKGLVHALNNRVAALSAFVELAKLGDEQEDPLTVLPTEIVQLHRVNALFGLLPQRSVEAEPLELRAVLDDAVRLHEHHPRFRGGQVSLTFEGAPGAVRAPRWALVHAMVMLVHAAKREAGSERDGGAAAIRVHGDEETVSVRVATRNAPSADLEALAVRCGGRVTRTDDELVLTMPSLRELRRREREARGESPAS
ncbi:MAG: hypothetical protein ACJ79A_05630 [Gemmatimonadaceae bacterium]